MRKENWNFTKFQAKQKIEEHFMCLWYRNRRQIWWFSGQKINKSCCFFYQDCQFLARNHQYWYHFRGPELSNLLNMSPISGEVLKISHSCPCYDQICWFSVYISGQEKTTRQVNFWSRKLPKLVTYGNSNQKN